MSGSALYKKIYDVFPKRMATVFIRFRKTLPFPYFLIFLLFILLHIAYLCFCSVSSHLLNIDKNLEKMQFWQLDTETLRSKKI